MYAIKISEGGRIVVPAEMRRALGLWAGDTLVGELRDGEFVLTTKQARMEAAVRHFHEFCSPEPGRFLVDQLIGERHAEAAREVHGGYISYSTPQRGRQGFMQSPV